MSDPRGMRFPATVPRSFIMRIFPGMHMPHKANVTEGRSTILAFCGCRSGHRTSFLSLIRKYRVRGPAEEENLKWSSKNSFAFPFHKPF